ncbi:MAG: VOC family protein [Leptospirales bacterium]
MELENGSGPLNIDSTFVVFDDQGVATPMEVRETFWQDLTDRFGDFSGKLLFSSFWFNKDWDNWEIHPYGDEVVFLLSGDFDFILDQDNAHRTVRLNNAGSFVIVPRGTWHTARVRCPSSALFLTPGRGTITKPSDRQVSPSEDSAGVMNGPPGISPKDPDEGSEMTQSPVLNQLNIVAGEFDRTLAFYRRLGLDITESPQSPEGIRHAKAKLPDGFLLEFDNQILARFYNAAWRGSGERGRTVIGFALPTREKVDHLYQELLSSGYKGLQSPYDAFWGQRYAIVADPDGNDIGLMSPPEETRRRWPPVESPVF